MSLVACADVQARAPFAVLTGVLWWRLRPGKTWVFSLPGTPSSRPSGSGECPLSVPWAVTGSRFIVDSAEWAARAWGLGAPSRPSREVGDAHPPSSPQVRLACRVKGTSIPGTHQCAYCGPRALWVSAPTGPCPAARYMALPA